MDGEPPLQNVLCNIAFRESKSRKLCNEILGKVFASGYVRVPRSGLERYVVQRMIEVGILVERQLPMCVGNRMVKVAVLNMAFIEQVYRLIQRPVLPPPCIETRR